MDLDLDLETDLEPVDDLDLEYDLDLLYDLDLDLDRDSLLMEESDLLRDLLLLDFDLFREYEDLLDDFPADFDLLCLFGDRDFDLE